MRKINQISNKEMVTAYITNLSGEGGGIISERLGCSRNTANAVCKRGKVIFENLETINRALAIFDMASSVDEMFVLANVVDYDAMRIDPNGEKNIHNTVGQIYEMVGHAKLHGTI